VRKNVMFDEEIVAFLKTVKASNQTTAKEGGYSGFLERLVRESAEYQAYRTHDASQQTSHKRQYQSEAVLAELEELRAQVKEQASQITHLEHLLDVEKRYLSDQQPRTFKAWLRKQPSSPLAEKLLADSLVPARGSRALYEAHVHRLHCTDDEVAAFKDLWKLMLLSRS